MNSIMQDLIGSLKTGLLGMGIVMVALYLLSLILDLMRHMFYPQARQVKKNESIAKPEIAEHDVDMDVQTIQDSADMQNSSELVAVIAAALSEYIQKPITNIKIGYIRRIHKTTPEWGMAARYENVHNNL
ncbi:MAG: OadG family protein [Tepidanaerobacteraceae bacterium]|nr:OadG family protein [Tepidanaerobacteraceae bacterium]